MRRIVQYDVVTGNEPLPIPWRCDVCLRIVSQYHTLNLSQRTLAKGEPVHADDLSELCEVPTPGEIAPGSERCG